jgi:hypothetical protein
MKKRLLLVAILAWWQASCDEDKSTLEVSSREIEMDASGNEQRLAVRTNEAIWEVVCDANWPVIERDNGDVVFTAASNPGRDPRAAKIIIAAGDRYERIILTQAGSLRVPGDPYPDAEHPVGLIYKVSDGGTHGMAVSLDQLQCAWGPAAIAHENARSFVDGRGNTRNIIATHENDATFATDYPAFAWILQKNGNDLDGGWYLPSYFELVEMYNLLVGNIYTIPEAGVPPSMQPVVTHNLAAREQFNAEMITWGGTPVNYPAAMYWSSSESSAGYACAVSFNGARDYTHTQVNYYAPTLFYVRAIYKF